jgi:hypothetical protein
MALFERGVGRLRRPLISQVRAFILRQLSKQQQNFAGWILPAHILVLLLPATGFHAEDSQIPVRLRAFRKIVEETKNHDLERDLYIEGRKAERGIYWRWPRSAAHFFAHSLWMIVMGFYWALSNYGRSVALPSMWLIASGFSFYYWGYPAVLAPVMPQSGTPDAEKCDHALGMLALGNAVPFVGPLTIDIKIKEFLFCPNDAASCQPPIPPEGFQFLVIFQNLLSIILVFFIGLALRNYFRIK